MIQNELFSLGNYSAPPRSKRKKYSAYAVDPAWEDGTAYPEIAKTNFDENDGLISGINQECDRSQENNTASVFLEETAKTSDGGDENECERSQENNTACVFLEETSDISDDDRWNPKDFNSTGVFQKEQDGQLLIFLDFSEEAPDPDDYPNLNEYEKAWKEWKDKEDSSNLICVQELAQDTALQVPLLDYNSSELQKSTTTAAQSLKSDTPASQTLATLQQLTHCQKQTLSPVRHLAPPSVLEECDWEQTMSVTVSPMLSKSSNELNPSIASLKMSPDCLPVHLDQEAKSYTLRDLHEYLMTTATDLRALSFPVQTLEAPTSDSDCSWLPSPTAYSSVSSRPPGLNKLESFLRNKNQLKTGEVINPKFLEESLGIPLDWTNPQNKSSVWEFLKAIAQLEEEGLLSEIVLTHELQPSESIEYFTSRASAQERRARGCLYKYIENKTLKNGSIVTYPRIDGERDENDATHWRWGFNWEEKVNGEWRNRSLGCIPHRVLSMIRAMQKLDTPLEKTIEFIKNSKGRKRA